MLWSTCRWLSAACCCRSDSCLQRKQTHEAKLPLSARGQMEVRVLHEKLREAQAEVSQMKLSHQKEVG